MGICTLLCLCSAYALILQVEAYSQTLNLVDSDFNFTEGNSQSPINIVTNDTFNVTFPPFTFQYGQKSPPITFEDYLNYFFDEDEAGDYYDDYDETAGFVNLDGSTLPPDYYDDDYYEETFNIPIQSQKISTVLNNGHTVTVNLEQNGMSMSGGNLSTLYKAIQIHMHWNANSTPGSEHTIDGKRYPMEMHIVHLSNDSNSINESLGKPDGIHVIAVLIEEGLEENESFTTLCSAVEEVEQPGNISFIWTADVLDLLPSHGTGPYFRYHGSLTTPPYAESVIWTVFNDTVLLSGKQLQTFSNVMFSSANITSNFRLPQPLNGREVLFCNSSATICQLVVNFWIFYLLCMLCIFL